ncbi:MAG: FkbM family methyltransferase [Candidatus Limnocylindrales bacterium]
MNEIRVALSRPLRVYLARTPLARGRGFLIRHVLSPLLPAPPAGFVLARPGGTHVRLDYREILGLSAIIEGGFEDEECRVMVRLAAKGTTAIDVGANVGIHTVPLARSVNPGRVMAIEPHEPNVRRLRTNLEANGLTNVDVYPMAAGPEDGTVMLHLADDAAYASIAEVPEGRGLDREVAVPQVRLDTLWEGAGRPSVSLLKIDVEGAEEAVLRGAGRLLSAQAPAIVVEANDAEHMRSLSSQLERHGYRQAPVAGFQPWNHLFLPARLPTHAAAPEGSPS